MIHGDISTRHIMCFENRLEKYGEEEWGLIDLEAAMIGTPLECAAEQSQLEARFRGCYLGSI